MDISSNTVVVTGFGSFRQYLVNSSWEAAKELLKLGLGDDVDIHIVELPVAYHKVKELVCKAWGNLNPKVTAEFIGKALQRIIREMLDQCNGENM
uniref:Pyroglutamyl-peptidase 1-like protein isoform X3 n=1 Tax=Pogona vitticeps TaxID=103695 RepID=A0ABM5EYQ2_9SAUR